MKPELQRRVQRYGWDKAAAYYEESWKDQLKPAQDRVMELADLKPGESVLETACGTGLVTERIAAAVAPDWLVIATDLSEEMTRKTADRLQMANGVDRSVIRADAEELPLDDHSVDAAICVLGIMYYPDPLKGLKEMQRVLRPGGRAAVTIWGERSNCGWAEIFPIVDKRVASDVCPMFFQQGTGNTLEMTMQMAGFADIRTERRKAELHFRDEETVVMAAFAGGPVALAYRKFDEETRLEAHKEYLASIAPYRNGSGYTIPGEFVYATASKT
jgi:ubiquinone/menaquinone biosynthesis C-methylase UbiE